MAATTAEQQLRQLREGDRLKYHGVQWRVVDYSTYTDRNGYETEEWLLRSQTGKEYYLMREFDPQNPERLVHWYMAEEVRNPILYEPRYSRNLTDALADEMRSHKTPYPELRMFNRTYQFESKTEGDYDPDGRSRTRITWDYWDAAHLWNLGLEAWSSGELSVYSTREVQPADFTDVKKGMGGAFANRFAVSTLQQEHSFSANSSKSSIPTLSRTTQLTLAWIITIVGFLLMISGI